MTIRERVGEILAIIRNGDSPEVAEARLQTSEMIHRTEASEQMLRDVQVSLDRKRTGFLLAEASNFDLAKILDETHGDHR